MRARRAAAPLALLALLACSSTRASALLQHQPPRPGNATATQPSFGPDEATEVTRKMFKIAARALNASGVVATGNCNANDMALLENETLWQVMKPCTTFHLNPFQTGTLHVEGFVKCLYNRGHLRMACGDCVAMFVEVALYNLCFFCLQREFCTPDCFECGQGGVNSSEKCIGVPEGGLLEHCVPVAD
mmetsp:Transcript_16313/g.47736  ORF Transcript_16313/g.47736 Transcript_16313/m.47736 type:complete len:188 (-) Transcript_16313:58-621(-)